MVPIVHFVRFANTYDQHYDNAVRVFGEPAMLHRLWDLRARRDIAEGDLIVFGKGEADQPISPVNGADEHYFPDAWRGDREAA